MARPALTIVISLVVLLMGGPKYAQADQIPCTGPPILGIYGGTITYVNNNDFIPEMFGIHVGDTFNGGFLYNIAPLYVSPNFGPIYESYEHDSLYDPSMVYNPPGLNYDYAHILLGAGGSGLDYNEAWSFLSINNRLAMQPSSWDWIDELSGVKNGLYMTSGNTQWKIALTLSEPTEPFPSDGVVTHEYNLNSFDNVQFQIFDTWTSGLTPVVTGEVTYVSLAAVPEPATVAMIATGLPLGLVFWCWKRRRAAA